VDGAFNMTDQTTNEQIRQWLAGAAERRGDELATDDPAVVRGRVGRLASSVDGGCTAWLDCPVCGLDGGPYSPAEAGQLGGVHDDLRHAGHPTVAVVPGGAA
jgi:hypothetical protein